MLLDVIELTHIVTPRTGEHVQGQLVTSGLA